MTMCFAPGALLQVKEIRAETDFFSDESLHNK